MSERRRTASEGHCASTRVPSPVISSYYSVWTCNGLSCWSPDTYLHLTAGSEAHDIDICEWQAFPVGLNMLRASEQCLNTWSDPGVIPVAFQWDYFLEVTLPCPSAHPASPLKLQWDENIYLMPVSDKTQFQEDTCAHSVSAQASPGRSYVFFCLPRDWNLLFSSHALVFSPHLSFDISTKGSVRHVRRWFAHSGKKGARPEVGSIRLSAGVETVASENRRIRRWSYAKSRSAEHHTQTLWSASAVNQCLHPFQDMKNSCFNGSNWSECYPRYQIEGRSLSCICNWAQNHLLVPY